MQEIRAAGFVVFRRRAGAIEYLTLRATKHGEWGPPKGHNDAGESDLEAARRETAEESGLAEIAVDPWFERRVDYRVKKGHKTVWFGLASSDGEVALSDEHDDARWASLDDTCSRVPHEAARAVFREAAIFLKDPCFRAGLDPARARTMLHERFDPEEPVLAHTALVAEMARAMAEAWREPDPDFVEACAWVHDIGRSIQHGPRHPIEGFRLMVAEGHPGYAPTCISHATKGRRGDEECARACDLSTFEKHERIVALTDFLAVRESKGTIEQRHADLVARYGASRWIDEARDIACGLKDEFERDTGLDLYEVAGIPG